MFEFGFQHALFNHSIRETPYVYAHALHAHTLHDINLYSPSPFLKNLNISRSTMLYRGLLFMQIFHIHSFNRYVLSAKYVSVTFLSTEDIALKNTEVLDILELKEALLSLE